MKRSFWITLLTAALVSGAAAQTIKLQPLSGRIKIDGRLTEKCWQRKADVERFYIFGAAPEDFRPVKTKASFAIDDRFLYVGVHCEEPFMSRLKLSGKQTDDPIWKDDSIELFFVPSAVKKSYVQIVINANGVVFDLFQKDPGITPSDLAWNSGTVCRTFKGRNFWSLEAAIPLENLPVDTPVGDWKFHVARNRAWKGELYSFVEGIKSFHDTDHFFTLAGVKLPHIKLTVPDYDLGEVKYGRNRARVVVKNWSSQKMTASVKTEGAAVHVPVEPRNTKIIHLDWIHPFGKPLCQREFVISENNKALRRLTLKKNLQKLFIDEKNAVFYVEHNKFLQIPLTLELTALSAKDSQVRWRIRDTRNREMVSGFTVPCNGKALLRVFWSFISPGRYFLDLELYHKGKKVASDKRELRFLNSPFEGI